MCSPGAESGGEKRGMADTLDERKRNGASTWRKVYAPSENLLTRSRESGNVYAVGLFNMGAAHALVVPFAILLHDSFKARRLSLDVEGYIKLLGYPSEWLVVAGILFAEFIFSFLIYYLFLLWVACYRRVGAVSNYVFLLLFVACVVVTRLAVFLAVFELDIHPAGRVTCNIQMVLLCMKWVSFIHENANKVVYPWHKEDETGPAVWYAGQMEPQIGSFSSYVYFIFCPVLLYRDRYPRKQRNLRRAFGHLVEFLMTNLIGYTLFKDFLVPQSMLLDDLVTCLIRCLFLGFLQLYLAHTCTMHAWMNMSAELTGFADRNFYQDWWNSQSLGEYLGKWNPVILEWLKSYFYAYLKSWAPRAVALLAILLLSAAEHDFLIGTGLGFFIPMYLVEYGLIGFLLSFKPSLGKQTDRLIMCVGLSLGTGILMTIYLTELVARSQCGASSSWFEGMWALECYRRFNN